MYRTRSVKLVILHLCLRVEHLNPPFPRTLQYELARKMDSADSDAVLTALQALGRRLHQTEEQYNALCLEMRVMSDSQVNFHSQVGLLTNGFQQLMDGLDTVIAPSAVLEPAPAAAAASVLSHTAPSALPPRLSPVPRDFRGILEIVGPF